MKAFPSNILLKRQSGFTLLEVLIAIGITAMIGLGSWQILNSAIRTSGLTQDKLDELKALQKTMLLMSRDFQQATSRSVRDEYGDYQPALTTKNKFFKLELSRAGWRNPLGDLRSNVQRVAYELDQDKLIRHYWNVLDRSQDSESIHRTLLTGVEELSFSFMNDSGSWADEWPSTASSSNSSTSTPLDPRKQDNTIPKAVKVTLTLKQFGKVSKLYDLVQYLEGQKFITSGTGTGTGSGSGSGSGGGS